MWRIIFYLFQNVENMGTIRCLVRNAIEGVSDRISLEDQGSMGKGLESYYNIIKMINQI